MKRRIVAVVVLTFLLISGCETRNVLVKPYTDPHTPGVAYALPKTLLQIEIPYTAVEETTEKHGLVVRTETTV
jgi:hypothetical protein